LLHQESRARRLRFAHLAALSGIALAAACAGQNGITPQITSSAAQAQPSITMARDFLGCSYPSGDVYQTDISGVSPDPDSSAYIAAYDAARGGNTGFIVNINAEMINHANTKTPNVQVQPENNYDHPYSPIPWQPYFKIEEAGDHHAEVISSKACQYYEGYLTEYDKSGNYLEMYNNEHIDLTKAFVRPATGALSTATGIPLGLLAVRPEELAAGIVRHAIGWNIVSGAANGVAGGPCVNPAGERDCTDGNAYDGPPSDTPMPYGSHARLKSTFNISGFSREAKIVALAMQKYGLYVYDSGCCNTIVLADDSHGEPVWTGEDSNNLETITPADFDIVPPPK
jgi:hypothetical protein